jgi:hypothetical protein
MITSKNNYYEEDERLFSTGDSELDDVLEEIYYSGIEDGYDYAQREFAVSIKGLKNKVKAIPRHLKRDFTAGKLAGKTLTGQNLSPEEVHRAAVNSRAVLIPGSKAASKATKKRFLDTRTGKIRTASKKELEQAAKAWERFDRRGRGATNVGFGYM